MSERAAGHCAREQATRLNTPVAQQKHAGDTENNYEQLMIDSGISSRVSFISSHYYPPRPTSMNNSRTTPMRCEYSQVRELERQELIFNMRRMIMLLNVTLNPFVLPPFWGPARRPV
jgi:hypothetical protein